MDVLLTGGSGRVGTAITDSLADKEDYSFVNVDPVAHPHPAVRSVTGGLTEIEEMRSLAANVDAVVHLARERLDTGHAFDRTPRWTPAHGRNMQLVATAIDAALEGGVETFVFGSSNHVVGLYERERAPDIYTRDSEFRIDHTVDPRPDSMYAVGKVYGEALGRFAAEQHGLQFYALRIGTVREPRYDHPYGAADRSVEEGKFDRDSEKYARSVARMKCTWLSRRDLAHLVERCLQNESVTFDIFYGVSDNRRSWFDIDHARDIIGYQPQDDAEKWSEPPSGRNG